jgi:hypothetical protein
MSQLSSLPGTCRILKIGYGDKTYLLREDLDLSECKSVCGRNPGYPVQTPVNLQEANDDCGNYISAYVQLQEAQAEFEKAKQEFCKSRGGRLFIPSYFLSRALYLLNILSHRKMSMLLQNFLEKQLVPKIQLQRLHLRFKATISV